MSQHKEPQAAHTHSQFLAQRWRSSTELWRQLCAWLPPPWSARRSSSTSMTRTSRCTTRWRIARRRCTTSISTGSSQRTPTWTTTTSRSTPFSPSCSSTECWCVRTSVCSMRLISACSTRRLGRAGAAARVHACPAAAQFLMIAAQAALVLWRKKHPRSYDLVRHARALAPERARGTHAATLRCTPPRVRVAQVTLVGLWLMPPMFCIQLHFWRFLTVSSWRAWAGWAGCSRSADRAGPPRGTSCRTCWQVWTVYSGVTLYVLSLCMNKKIENTTPRLVSHHAGPSSLCLGGGCLLLFAASPWQHCCVG